MKCPRCNAQLSTKTYEGVAIDRCEQCGGVFLDAGEIGIIAKTRDATFDPKLVTDSLKTANTGIPEAEKASTEHCPKCSSKMSPLNYNYSSGVIVDVCPKGHGMWLDKDELEKIQAHVEHWDDKKAKESKNWTALANSASSESAKATLEANKDFRKNLSKSARVIDSVLGWLAQKG